MATHVSTRRAVDVTGSVTGNRSGSPGALTLDEAAAYVAQRALRPSRIGAVGLEMEWHLIDAADPLRRPSWSRVQSLVGSLPPLPAGSWLSVEPGGQLELSTVPAEGIAGAVAALSQDQAVLATHVDRHGLLAVSGGADPARPPRRTNPAPRYVAMEAHFEATGSAAAGRAMMSSTASLQVNLEAGPARGWRARLELAHRLGPVLVAFSACSPALGGQASGWRSMRQQIWGRLDRRRCGPVLRGVRPAEEWADYALRAPVMLVRHPDNGPGNEAASEPVGSRVPFASWVTGDAPLGGRRPVLDDLDYHLTTLWPPVRPRGFLEIRCLDAVPDPWWRGLAAITATLLDDAVAADAAAAATEPVSAAWSVAARDGLADPRLRRAAQQCVDAAVRRCPETLRRDVEDYAELVASGRTPGDLLPPAGVSSAWIGRA